MSWFAFIFWYWQKLQNHVENTCEKKNLKDALIFNNHLGAVHAQNLSI